MIKWSESTLGEISVRMADGPFGSNLKKEHYTDNKEVRIIQLSNIGEDGWREENTKYTTFEHLKTISRSEVFPEDIVIAKMMPAGRAILCPNHEKRFVLSSDAVKAEIKDGYNKKFVLYSINSPYFRNQVYENVTGSGRVRTSLTKLRDCKLRIPSLSEQQRIVALLDAEFAKIDVLKANAEKNLQNAKDLFQAALKKELEPKEGWITKTLGDVCDVQCGSTPLRSEPLFWENGTYPWFTVDDIREQGRVITDTKQKITKLAWDKLRVFPVNSVLLCCTASVGEYAITTIPLTSNQQFNGLTIKKGFDITPMYLFHFASTLKDKLLKLSGKATIDFVSGAKVKSIVISYPSMAEQQSIVARLDALNEKCKTLQANYEKTLTLCDDLKQALLRKAFNGEI